MADPFSQIYPFATPQGPTLSGLPTRTSSLSGVEQPGAKGGQQPGMPSRVSPALSVLFQSLSQGQAGNLPKGVSTSNLFASPILASLSPNLVGFGGGGGGTSPIGGATGGGAGAIGGPFEPGSTLNPTSASDVLLQQLIALLSQPQPAPAAATSLSAAPQPATTAGTQTAGGDANPIGALASIGTLAGLLTPQEQQKMAGGFTVQPTPLIPTDPLTGLPGGASVMSSPFVTEGTGPALPVGTTTQDILQRTGPQTVVGETAGLGTSGALGIGGQALGVLGQFGPLAGMDPELARYLTGAGQLSGLGSQITAPSTVPNLQAGGAGGFATGAGIAGNVLGLGGTAANIAGAPPEVGFGLQLGGAAAGLGSAIGSAAAAGAAGGAGTTASAGLGALGSGWIGAVTIPAMVNMFLNQADRARDLKFNANQAKRIIQGMGGGKDIQTFINRLADPKDVKAPGEFGTWIKEMTKLVGLMNRIPGAKTDQLAKAMTFGWAAAAKDPTRYAQALTSASKAMGFTNSSNWKDPRVVSEAYARLGLAGRGLFPVPPPPGVALPAPDYAERTRPMGPMISQPFFAGSADRPAQTQPDVFAKWRGVADPYAAWYRQTYGTNPPGTTPAPTAPTRNPIPFTLMETRGGANRFV